MVTLKNKPGVDEAGLGKVRNLCFDFFFFHQRHPHTVIVTMRVGCLNEEFSALVLAVFSLYRPCSLPTLGNSHGSHISVVL